jgi:hypothetical protein
MAAIHAAGPTASLARGSNAPGVVVVESTRDGGRKILISGGGRCNILPGELDESRFVTDSSANTMKKMLRSWPLSAQRAFFEQELGIELRLEKETGKLFPASNRARDVRDALVSCASSRGARLRFESPVAALARIERGGQSPLWQLTMRSGETLDACAVILATGGLSVPKTGSDGSGLRIAGELGHHLQPTYAALTPLLDETATFAGLAGISLDVTLEASGGRRPLRTRGGFLFTHRGYSGPSVLDLSHVAVRSLEHRSAPGETSSQPVTQKILQKILASWTALDREDWERELEPRRAGVLGVIRQHLPSRLAERLLDVAGIPPQRSLAELRSGERRALLEVLTRAELPWTGHEGYRSAEVTGGGIALSDVDPRTMQSRVAAGLFLCGEMLDAFGPIGGFNFAWAWATGRAAGEGARAYAASGDAAARVQKGA